MTDIADCEPQRRTALRLAVPFLRCPVCGMPLTATATSVACDSGHSFDIARQGYVSFLTGNAGASTADSAEMVAARARFLAGGSYDRIADAVAAALGVRGEVDSAVPEERGLVLEIGGGTGFYLDHLLGGRPDLIGVDLDLSVRALRVAARAHERLAAIAADAWLPLPLVDDSAAVILSIFSPRNPAEMARVLAPGGRLVVVSPTPRHLGELVSSLGLVTVDERKPERLERQFDAFQLLALDAVEYSVVLDAGAARDVVLMGPSARHLGATRLETIPPEMTVTVSVEVRTYSLP